MLILIWRIDKTYYRTQDQNYCSYHMTVNILTSYCQLWTFLDLCVSYLPFKSPILVSYFESLQVQDQARFHKESEKTFHKEFEMRGPSNLTKASKTRSLKNLTPAKSRIPCQIQEGIKVEKGELCCWLWHWSYDRSAGQKHLIIERINQFGIIFLSDYSWTLKLSCNMYQGSSVIT